MYAIAFDLEIAVLKELYHVDSWQNAYGDIRKFLEPRGYAWQQKSVYFGDETVTAVTCVLTVQELSRKFPWFAPAVKDIRMLRITDDNDLNPAVQSAMATAEMA
jgi:virulence-associated protein VapD